MAAQWEHLFCSAGLWGNRGWGFQWEGQFEPLDDALARFGSEGWESTGFQLVTEPGSGFQWLYFLFKRHQAQ